VITARGLTRTFRTGGRSVEAVRGIDLHVRPGELVGFLGPNGAGKTTTLRMLATLLRPTSGDATVAGCDLRTDPAGVRRRIGYVGQGNGAGLDQRVAQELVLQGRFHGLGATAATRRATELLDRFDLTEVAGRAAGTLSGGQRRRLDLALGLMHAPDLLFLDEPSTGLDPRSRGALWELVRELRDRHGVTMLLSTHYLDEADALCDTLLVIDQGRIVAAGTPDELRGKVAGDLVVLTARDPARTAELAGRLPGATELTVTDGAVRFRVPRGDTALPVLLRELDLADLPVQAVRTQRPTLDDVFHSVTGRSLREVEA
jgi:ABC-2 type transport system ATP-binding protein